MSTLTWDDVAVDSWEREYIVEFCGFCGRRLILKANREYAALRCPKWYSLLDWLKGQPEIHYYKLIGKVKSSRYDPKTGKQLVKTKRGIPWRVSTIVPLELAVLAGSIALHIGFFSFFPAVVTTWLWIQWVQS